MVWLWLGCRAVSPEPAVVREPGVRVTVAAEDVRLETPVRRLVRDGGPEVWLAGAVHVAEPAYYDALSGSLDGCAQVLREGLEPEPGAPEPSTDLGPLLAVHGLTRQGERLEDAEGWRRVDLSVAEVRDALRAAGADAETVTAWLDDRDQSMLVELLRGASGEPRASALARLALLRGLADPPPSEEPEASLYWDVIVGLRNHAVVDEVGGAGPVGVVYGADHLADLEDRLGRRGWRRVSEAWLPVLVVRHEDLGLGPVQVDQLLRGARGGALR